MTLASFIAFFILFLLVGLSAASRAKSSRADYYLASQSVPPVLVGLSAVATNNSGYMFIGVIGYTFETGLAAAWLMVGWIVGDLMISLVTHGPLRAASQGSDQATYTGIISRWYGNDYQGFRRVGGLVSVVFLGAYAAAQMDAGGKALLALFGWPVDVGAVIVALVVAAYCLAGGIRASIWTDAAQALVMLAAMAVLLHVAVGALGGPRAAWATLSAIDGYTDWRPPDSSLIVPGMPGMIAFGLGWLFAGISVAGQPHIMVRFIALASTRQMMAARLWYYGFFVLFYCAATGVGMLSRVLLPELGAIDPELALPTMAAELLPPVLVGLIVAGIFAATMSTADSLVLSCSAAVTNDLPRRPWTGLAAIKATTLGVTVLALSFALGDNQSVFQLVILAWSSLAAAFVPVLVVFVRGGKPSEALVLLMMFAGMGTAWWWRMQGWHESVYEGLPGIVAGLGVYLVARARAAVPRTAP